MKSTARTTKSGLCKIFASLVFYFCFCTQLITAQSPVGTWTLISASYNNNPIDDASGYLKLLNQEDYTASFSDGTNTGYANAHYSMVGNIFKTNIDGLNLVINGYSSSFSYPGYVIIYQTMINSSLIAFRNYVGAAIGYGQPTLQVSGDSLILKSKNGNAKINYIKGDYTLSPNFIVSANYGVSPFTVQFTNQSSGTIDNWLWDFGDGNTSTDENPNHTYQAPGTYTVKLEISNKYVTASKTKIDEIKALNEFEVKAQFSYLLSETNSLEIKLEDNSLGSISNWEWDFGDGETSSEKNPVHVYNFPGEYNIILKISNSTNTDFVSQTVNLGEKWKVLAGKDFDSSPAIGKDGTIYVGCNDSCLYAFNSDSTLKWKYKTDNSIYSSPTISGSGTIYIGSVDEHLYAIHPNGSLKWKFKTGAAIKSSPAIAADGTVYIGSYDDYLWAIDKNGTEKWKFKTGKDILSSPTIDKNGVIYFGGLDDKVYALTPDGNKKWEYTTNGDISSSPAIGNDGKIFVGGTDDYLYAFNADGSLHWKYKTNGNVYSSPSISDDGTIYFGSYDDYLYALNSDGTLKWRYETEANIESTPAISSDGTIYFGSNDNYFYALNPDGTLKWKYKTEGDIESSPIISSDGIVYVGGQDNVFYAFDGKSGKLAESAWPCFRRNNLHTGNSDITVNAKEIKHYTNFKFYPNPTQGKIKIEGLPVNRQFKIEIYNVSGKLISQINHNGAKAELDISHEVPGIYLVKINGTNSKSFIIIKE